MAQTRTRLLTAVLTITAALLGSAAVASAQTVTVTRKSSSVVYAEFTAKSRLRGHYAAFDVTSSANVTDAWVRIENFSGPQLGLAAGEDGLVHIGPLAAGSTRTVFFYLLASAATTVAESYQVGLYEGPPAFGGLVGTRQTFTSTISDTIQANANKVVSGSVDVGSGAFVGGTVVVTVNGQTGTVGTAGTAHFTPAAIETWPANVFELQASSIALTQSGVTTTYTNNLSISELNAQYTYVATYTFRIAGVKPTATSMSPTAYIHSGGEHKHTAVDTFANVPPIPPVTMSMWMEKTASPTLMLGGGTASYAVSLHNTGPTPVALDQIVDTLPAGATYVPNSSVYDGLPVSDPLASGSTLTWSRLFEIPAASTKVLTFQLQIPSSPGIYRNSVVALVGNGTVYGSLSGTTPAFVDVVVDPVPNPDFTVDVSHTGTVSAGSATPVPFSIVVSNTGSGATTGSSGQVSVIFELTSGMVPGTVSGSGWTCSTTGQLVTCTRNDGLAIGASYPAITVDATASASVPGIVSGTATVSGGSEPAGVTGNNTAVDSAVVSRSLDLLLSKTHIGNVVPGQTDATFALSVTNLGSTPLAAGTTVSVSDTLPAGLTLSGGAASFDGTGWTCTAATLTCTRADGLAAFSSYPSITVVTTVAAGASGSLTNTATLAAVSGEATTANNTATDTVQVLTTGVDLTIAVRHIDPWTQGDTGQQYLIDVTNFSGAASTSGTVTVASTLPAGLTPTAAAGTGWSCGISGQTVTCTRSDVLAAGDVYPTLVLSVDVDPSAPSSVTTTATVSGGGDTNAGNNAASDVTPIVTITPDLAMTVSHFGDFQRGTTEAVMFSVSNVGGAASSGTVTVASTLPADLVPTTASGFGWTCSVTGQDVSCTRSDALGIGGTYPAISVGVNVLGSAPDSVVVDATVSGGGDVSATNDTASDTIAVGGGPDLRVTLWHTGDFTAGDTTETYNAAVSNLGAAPSSGAVTVTLSMPAGMTPVSVSASGWSCSIVGQDVTCTRSDALAPAASFPTVVVTVAVGPSTGTVTATASVSGGSDSDVSNNTASDPTTIVPAPEPDLQTTVTPQGTFTQGGTGSYVIDVANTGTGATTDPVTVTTTLPDGVTPTAAGGDGWSCTLTGQTVTCTRSDSLPAGSSYPPVTISVAISTSAPTPVTTTVTTSGGGDPTPGTSGSTTPVAPGTPDLQTTVTPQGTFTQGGTGSYVIDVANTGTGATTDPVTVTTTLPDGVTPTAAGGDGWSCTLTGQTVTCTRSDSLPAGSSYPPVTISVAISTSAPTPVTTTVTTSGGGDPTPGTGGSTTSVTPAAVTMADIEVSLVDLAWGLPGKQDGYRVRVRNLGPADSHGVVIAAALPFGLTLITATPSSGAFDSGTGDWTIPNLGSGGTAELHFVVRVDESSALARASFTAGDVYDPNSANNHAAARIDGTPTADVQVGIRASSSVVPVGSFTRLTVVAGNAGPARADRVTLRVTVPTGLVVESASTTTGIFDATSGLWTIESLQTSETAELHLDSRVVVAGALVLNALKVASEPNDPAAVNDEAALVLNSAQVDLQVVLSIDRTSVIRGEAVTARVHLTNVTRAHAHDVRVNFPMPSGFGYVSHQATTGLYDPASGHWNLSELGPAGGENSATLTVVGRVEQLLTSRLEASLSSLQERDVVAANDRSSERVRGTQWSTFLTDLVLRAEARPQLASPGELVTYVVSSTNRGPSYTSDLSITGSIPEGATYASVTPSGGGECNMPPVGGTGRFSCMWPGTTRLESRTLSLVVRIGASAMASSTVLVAFQSSSDVGEFYPPDNAVLTAVTVAGGSGADLRITSSASSDGQIGSALSLPVGAQAVLTFEVRNVGSSSTEGSTYLVRGMQPDELEFEEFLARDGVVISADAGRLSGDEATDSVVAYDGGLTTMWSLGPMAPGATARLQVRVRVIGLRASSLSVMRIQTWPGDINPTNDSATVTIDGVGAVGRHGRWLATGDVDGTPGDELLVGGGGAETPFVAMLRRDGQDRRVAAYDRRFVGGVRVATCDANGDGQPDLVTGAGPYSGPHVRVLEVRSNAVEELFGFYAFEEPFRNGVTVACADVDGNGADEIIVGREQGGTPDVAVFALSPDGVRQVAAFQPYEASFTGGVRVITVPRAVAAATGADFDFLTVPGPGRAFQVDAWRVAGSAVTHVRTVTASGDYTSGAFLAAGDLDLDGQLDLVLGSEGEGDARVAVVRYTDGQVRTVLQPYAGEPVRGVHVAVGHMAGEAQPWVFMTPAEGPSAGVDVYRFVNGALVKVGRAAVVEVP